MAELLDILGKAAMRLSAPAVQTIDTAYQPLLFDQVAVERGGLTADPNTNSITVGSSGLYTVNMGIDAAFQGELQVVAFVNDAAYSTYPVHIQGRGNNRPVALFWQSTVTLAGGDVLTLQAKNFDTGSFDLNLFRMYLCVIKEH